MKKITSLLLAAVLAVLAINLFALIGFVALDFSVIERDHTALDLVLDGVVRTAQMLGYAVNRPTVFQPNFNFVFRRSFSGRSMFLMDSRPRST